MESSLQVPDPSLPGPSRQQSSRPVSVQPTSSAASQSPSRKRASHQVVTTQPQDEQPAYRDVYSHPAAVEYAAAHPRRTIPKFGPYLLLQTLGEGEFGKVKLGLHMQWGEEVAVKLIRRGNIDSSIRMSKVEREIEVLRTLKHPNIVRLYDVIETDKYIGIILEYASGGELFDHILAHRYLKEKDACKLFSQLISGVSYIHSKKIVHRDLKLENLLLDRNRNVIITDFGFANRFEHQADDLMQTSCGSPCYAAPELVISDGLYVGSAVDIWSCGVILYAMLAGYLPFDDDPANPDGDNINLLYKYIVNTPLSFPDYISDDARDLLGVMLVPDPQRRAGLPAIMTHRWLAPCASIFSKSVADLERAAMEQHHQKRLAYQRQMKHSAEVSASKVSRSHSARTDTFVAGAPPSSSRRTAQPEYLYETSVDQSMYASPAAQSSSHRGFTSAIVLPTSPSVPLDDDPFAPSPDVPSISVLDQTSNTASTEPAPHTEHRHRHESEVGHRKSAVPTPVIAPVKTSPDGKRPKAGFRHTIQVEYGEQATDEPQGLTQPTRRPSVRERVTPAPEPTPKKPSLEVASKLHTGAHQSVGSPKAPAVQATPAPPPISIEVTSPPTTPMATPDKATHVQASSTSTGSGSVSSKQSRHKKGLSIDKIGISNIFSSKPDVTQSSLISRVPSERSSPARPPSADTITASRPDPNRRPITLQISPATTPVVDADSKTALLSPDSAASKKSSRRNTLTVMVEPFRSSIKQRTKGRIASETPIKETPPQEKEKEKEEKERPPPSTPKGALAPPTQQFANAARTDIGAAGIPASTVKANRVMQWFRSKSKGSRPLDMPDDAEKSILPSDTGGMPAPTTHTAAASSSSTVSNAAAALLATPTSEKARTTPLADASFSGIALVRKLGGGGSTSAKGVLRVHHGAVDQTTITSGSPPEVMRHVRQVLENMGVDIQMESDYKYRCVRPKRRRIGAGVGLGLRESTGSGLAAFAMSGTAASNGVDKRGLPLPSQSHTSFGSTGGMLRGLLMRRQSSQVSANSVNALQHHAFDNEPSAEATDTSSPTVPDAVYGDTQQDQGDEVRFSVELTRMDRLDDTYSLDIRRLKGNLRSYKFLYDTLRERANLQR